jgi:starvation-inducible outer membrane lipoprotein
MKKLMMTAALALGLSACASTYTSIERQDDGTYVLTRVKQGFFSVGSNVYTCTESSAGLSCRPLN